MMMMTMLPWQPITWQSRQIPWADALRGPAASSVHVNGLGTKFFPKGFQYEQAGFLPEFYILRRKI